MCEKLEFLYEFPVMVVLVEFNAPHVLSVCFLKAARPLKAPFLSCFSMLALVCNWLQGLYGVAEVPLCVFVVRHIWIVILREVELKVFKYPTWHCIIP